MPRKTRLSMTDKRLGEMRSHASFTLLTLLRSIPALCHTQCFGDALQLFERYSEASALTVLYSDAPVGLIIRSSIVDTVSLPCYRNSIAQTIGRESCLCFVSIAPIIVAHDSSKHEIRRLLWSRGTDCLCAPLVVTKRSRYLGMIERNALDAALTELETSPRMRCLASH